MLNEKEKTAFIKGLEKSLKKNTLDRPDEELFEGAKNLYEFLNHAKKLHDVAKHEKEIIGKNAIEKRRQRILAIAAGYKPRKIRYTPKRIRTLKTW